MDYNEFLKALASGDGAVTEALFGVCDCPPHKSDAAVLLGCGTENALRRADICADFYLNGYTKLIIASGGVFHECNGRQMRECEIMAERLIERGVPRDAVIEERQAKNTIGNMVFSLGKLCGLGFMESDFKSITVITEPYHLKRSLLLARTYFPDFIKIYGYTQGALKQKSLWSADGELRKSVDGEIYFLKQLIENGKVPKEYAL